MWSFYRFVSPRSTGRPSLAGEWGKESLGRDRSSWHTGTLLDLS